MILTPIKTKGFEHLFRHPTSGIYYFRRYRSPHGEITRSCKTTDAEEAKKKRDEFNKELFERTEPLPLIARNISPDKMTALELFDKFIARRESANKAQTTVQSIRATRKHVASYFETMMPSEITAAWWESVFIPETRRLKWTNRGGYSMRVERRTDRKFFNNCKHVTQFLLQLVDDGILPRAPKLINPDTGGSPGKVFTDDEVKRLLAGSTGDLHLMVLMAATMGMRRGEILKLQWEWIDLVNNTIFLPAWATKIREERKFKISRRVIQVLMDRETRHTSAFVFPHVSLPKRAAHDDWMKKPWYRLKASLKIVGRFHDLRHTFLTNAFKAPNANPALICHYAGLSLKTAIDTYLHYNEEDSKVVAELVQYE